MRDKSYASEAANSRILGATRLHCDDYKDDIINEEMYYETGGGLTERNLARGDVRESQCDRFNRELRKGQAGERIPFHPDND